MVLPELFPRINLDDSTEQILLICSDGVWEFMSAQEAQTADVA